MARIPDIERRLQNWARWKIGATSGSMGYSTATMGERVDNGGFDAQARVPTSDCEADETDEGIRSMPQPLQDTLLQVYVKPRGKRENARLLGSAEATVTSRVDLAHRLLAGWLAARAEQGRIERARVERLQRSRTL